MMLKVDSGSIYEFCARPTDAAIELLMEEFTGAFDFEHCSVLAEYVCHPDSVMREAAREMLVTAGQAELVRIDGGSIATGRPASW
jgi:hypothetical protein